MQSDRVPAPQHQASPKFIDTMHQQQQHASLMTSSFNYPLSAPPTATTFSDVRPFWSGADSHTAAMDVDFAASGAQALECPTTLQHQLESAGWTQTSQVSQAYIIEGADTFQQQQQQRQYEGHGLRQIHSKHVPQPILETAFIDHQALYADSYPTPVDDPFGAISPHSGVNPGLLFNRPRSSTIDLLDSAPSFTNTSLTMVDAAKFETRKIPKHPGSSIRHVSCVTQSSPPQALQRLAPSVAQPRGLRRTSSAKEIASRRRAGERTLASSPVKSASRPVLARSQSDNRGSRLRGRASLPTLAPALNTLSTTPTLSQGAETFSSPGAGLGITRSASVSSSQQTGRSSPVRLHQQPRQQPNSQSHLHLSSLTSIPEVTTPQSRASVTFTIDANGRAWAEKSLGHNDDMTPRSMLRRNRSARSFQSKSKWDSSDDDSSSTDDEPIVVPSRTTSFALPEFTKPPINGLPLHSMQGSVSDRSTDSTTIAIPGDGLHTDSESETETEMGNVPKIAGDAASELEKLRQVRQQRVSLGAQGRGSISTSHFFVGSQQQVPNIDRSLGKSFGFAGATDFHRAMQAVSPLDASLPTRSHAPSRSHEIRCICGCPDAPSNSDGYIVQCGMCELWLHGRCINITKRTLPSVYICAFCAVAANAHNMQMPPPGAGSSPLAHKSFKSLR